MADLPLSEAVHPLQKKEERQGKKVKSGKERRRREKLKETERIEMNTFKYSPLDSETDGIRLIKLKASLIESEIECEIDHVTYAEKPKYECLSYTWGSPSVVKTIRLNGSNFLVRENLFWALYCLKVAKKESLLWVDAICINQNDTEERNRQVDLMGFIFNRAQKVLVWLGYSTTPSVLYREYNYKANWKQIYPWLLGRDYWSRAWIVQEVCLARSIQCFYHFDDYTFFQDWAEMMGKLKQCPIDDKGSPLKLHTQRKNRHGNSTSLVRLLENFSDAKCSDPRDKIYAFLGLAHDAQDGSLAVDYSKPLFDLYLDVIRFHNRSRPAFDSLGSREFSWNTGFTEDESTDEKSDPEVRIVAFSVLLQQLFERGIEADAQLIGSKNLPNQPTFEITARALVEARIIHLGPQYSDVVGSAQASKTWKLAFQEYYQTPHDLIRLREQDEAYTAVLIDRNDRELDRIKKYPKICSLAVLSTQGWPHSTGNVISYSPRKQRAGEVWRPIMVESTDLGMEQVWIKNEKMPNFELDTFAEPRRFLGSNTCMGLVPSWAKVGDFICRFWDCNVAAVLRPCRDFDGTFTIIGRADMATRWNKEENFPTPINPTMSFEGGGMVDITLDAHELQRLTR